MTAASTSVPTKARAPRWGVLAAAALVLVCHLLAIHRQSLSGDGAYHLMAGHQALRYGQNTLNLEHPPLAKMVMALPLLAEPPILPPLEVDDALAAIDTMHADEDRIRRATVRGRYLNALVFVLPFFWACHAWGRAMAGPAVAVVLVLMLGLSFTVVPNLALLQTDAAVSLAFLLVLLAAHRVGWRDGGYRHAMALGLACGLAVAVKFSGVLAAVPALVALIVAHRRHRAWRRSLAAIALVAAGAGVVVETTYALANRHYDSGLGRTTIERYGTNQGTLVVDDELRPWISQLLAIERFDPRMAQWWTGFLGVRAQNAIGVYPSFALGKVSSSGRWWYFPVLFAVKTPLLVLGLLLAAVLALRSPPLRVRAAGFADHPLLPAVALTVVYLGTAITSSYNLGVRHLLPILPVLYLPAAALAVRVPRLPTVVVGVLALECLLLAPHWLAATNTWWLGARNPTRFAFSHGNLTYRQNFILLAEAAEARQIEGLRVLYPLLGEQVVRAYLDDAEMVRLDQPLEPGWYAVSAFVEQMVPALLTAPPGAVYGQDGLVTLARAWLPVWQAIAGGEDHGYVAGTFHLYYHPKAPALPALGTPPVAP